MAASALDDGIEPHRVACRGPHPDRLPRPGDQFEQAGFHDEQARAVGSLRRHEGAVEADRPGAPRLDAAQVPPVAGRLRGQQVGLGRPHAPRVVGAKETFSTEFGDDRERVDVTFDQTSRRQVGPADIDEGLPPELRRARTRKRKLCQWPQLGAQQCNALTLTLGEQLREHRWRAPLSDPDHRSASIGPSSRV